MNRGVSLPIKWVDPKGVEIKIEIEWNGDIAQHAKYDCAIFLGILFHK